MRRLKSHLRMAAIGAHDFPGALNYGLVVPGGEAMIQRFGASLVACVVVTTAAAQAPAGAPAADAARAAPFVARARAAAGNEWGATVDFFCGDAGRANRADDPE